MNYPSKDKTRMRTRSTFESFNSHTSFFSDGRKQLCLKLGNADEDDQAWSVVLSIKCALDILL